MNPDFSRGFNARVSRRVFLRVGGGALAIAATAAAMPAFTHWPDSDARPRIRVPAGFVPRIVARSGYPSCAGADYPWHPFPDGGACFDAGDGGWVYVSNRETPVDGGAGALRFDASGRIVDSYQILAGGRMNCSGGPTPWGSWLSCEEVADGRVWECDPFNRRPPVAHDGLGLFEHEAACVDPRTRQIYLTEDQISGCLYRFTPDDALTSPVPDLGSGTLEVAMVSKGLVSWEKILDPTTGTTAVRRRVDERAHYAGAEGIDIYDRYLRFTTKYDNRIWELDLDDGRIRVLRDLQGLVHDVDDLTHAPNGAFLVAEDGPQMRIMYFADAESPPARLVQLYGHSKSEITGLAFSPAGDRLYFSSQRGTAGKGWHGLSFELHGDFSSLGADLELREWVFDQDEIRLAG